MATSPAVTLGSYGDNAAGYTTACWLTVALPPFWISSARAPIAPSPAASVEARATIRLTVAHGEFDEATASAEVVPTARLPPAASAPTASVPSSVRPMRAVTPDLFLAECM